MRGHGPLSKACAGGGDGAVDVRGVASGTRPITSSVCGETTSMVPVPAGATHSPPM